MPEVTTPSVWRWLVWSLRVNMWLTLRQIRGASQYWVRSLMLTGMHEAANRCRTGTNSSTVAWELNHYGQIITWSDGAVCVCVCVCERACVRMRRQVCLTWGRRRHIKHYTVIQFTNNVNHFGMCLSGHFSLLLIILPFFPQQLPKLQHNSQYYILFIPRLVFARYLCHLHHTVCLNWLWTGCISSWMDCWPIRGRPRVLVANLCNYKW